LSACWRSRTASWPRHRGGGGADGVARRHGPRLHAAPQPLPRRVVLTPRSLHPFPPVIPEAAAQRRLCGTPHLASHSRLLASRGLDPRAPAAPLARSLDLASPPPAPWLPPAWPATRSAGCAAPSGRRTGRTGSTRLVVVQVVVPIVAHVRHAPSRKLRTAARPPSARRHATRACVFAPSAGTREVAQSRARGDGNRIDRSKRRLPPPPLQIWPKRRVSAHWATGSFTLGRDGEPCCRDCVTAAQLQPRSHNLVRFHGATLGERSGTIIRRRRPRGLPRSW